MSRKRQLASLNPAFLPTLLGNGAQIRIFSSTRRLKTESSFSSSVHHSRSRSSKTATKGAIGEGYRR